MLDTFSYHNFSWQGDMRWYKASKYTRYAPVVVVVLMFLSIAEIAFGSVWIANLGDTMTVPKIIQTLLIPGCSFFNVIPSLHLHLLLRINPPTLALCFSSIFSFVYLFSTLLMLASCGPSAKGVLRPLRRSECYLGIEGGPTRYGVTKGIWAAFQACNLLSAILYAYHAALAYYVLRGINQRKAAGIVEVEDPEVIAERRAKAREEWVRMTKRGL
ncbi:MAG: hypothetical protein L6R40_004050 [Gallowayella cf. fulva]|nr:MAG: hypothetical protein L6R40_004050 [Xanthomendoza cf. fulva]